jgi:hypothetical protein
MPPGCLTGGNEVSVGRVRCEMLLRQATGSEALGASLLLPRGAGSHK